MEVQSPDVTTAKLLGWHRPDAGIQLARSLVTAEWQVRQRAE